jgi:hypothetical protein
MENGDRGAFDKAAEDKPTLHQGVLNDEIVDRGTTKAKTTTTDKK